MITEEQKGGFMYWIRESIAIKLIFIGVLALVLLIPSVWVLNLIDERAGRQAEVTSEIAQQWSGQQQFSGPVLVIPVTKQVHEKDGNKELVRNETDNLYLLPEDLHIKANLTTTKLNRGIFEAAVYNSILHVSGLFKQADIARLDAEKTQLQPEKARLVFGITDLKGLRSTPAVNINGQQVIAEPVYDEASPFKNGLQIAFNAPAQKDGSIPFNFTLDLKGSEQLSFLHVGKTTQVDATGNWATPSFDGRYIPDERKVTKQGFSAHWKMLYYNRPYPQQWLGNNKLLDDTSRRSDASFHIKLRLPVDQYQKTSRTAKYAILIILLTFVSLFLTELIRKQRIHVFNYLLIGAAMVIYYALLLSFAERVGYNWAYLIASVATIGLVSVFIASLIRNRPAALLFAAILVLFYGFIFIIIQLEDMALMVGSIALFAITGSLMYFSRKINWDKH